MFTKVHTTEFNVESVIKIDSYNSFLKLLRITAWIFRFLKNLKNKVLTFTRTSHRKKLTDAIIWEMDGFRHIFPTVWENTTKPMAGKSMGNQ